MAVPRPHGSTQASWQYPGMSQNQYPGMSQNQYPGMSQNQCVIQPLGSPWVSLKRSYARVPSVPEPVRGVHDPWMCVPGVVRAWVYQEGAIPGTTH